MCIVRRPNNTFYTLQVVPIEETSIENFDNVKKHKSITHYGGAGRTRLRNDEVTTFVGTPFLQG